MNKNYNFLPNTPIGEDKFEGQSQEKIANVLKEILCDSNFQIVGIDGSWGTGKSNLVEIVNKKLTNHKFFIYDVWGHQEDEQRRAILLELTEYLSSDDLIKNKQTWVKKVELLLSKKKATTTINQPFLSLGFIFSLLAIIYVPMVNVFVKKEGYLDWGHDWWRILLVGVPIIAVILIYFINVIEQLNKGSKGESFKIALMNTFLVYNNKQEKETKIETISENEPSVQEFRNWMKEIDNDLGDKKLILVFDNFDRLPKKHIISIWSSLHVFFSEEKYKNIKVIVPFDRDHIKNAFKEHNGDKGDYANDYINKTFDLVYRVAPPILSSWKSFLSENWKLAFPNGEIKEYLQVELAYEVLNKSITPREIIAFINELVSIKLLQNEIPERYIAIFSLKKDIILESPLKAIIKLDYLQSLSYVYREDENFQKYITALAYQIDSDSALEVIYRGQIKDFLLKGDSKGLKAISKTMVFERIINSVIDELELYDSPIEVLNTLSIEDMAEHHLDLIWNNLYFKLKSNYSKNQSLEMYKKILLKRIDKAYKVIWLKIILDDLNEIEVVSEYVDQIDDLNEFIVKEAIDLNLEKYLPKKECEVFDFLDLIKQKKDTYDFYLITCNDEQLDKELAVFTIDSVIEHSEIKFFKNINKLERFISHLKTLIPENYGKSQHMEMLLDILKKLSNERLTGLLNDDQLHSAFTNNPVGSNLFSDLLLMKIHVGSSINHYYQVTFDNVYNEINETNALEIALKIPQYFTIDEYLNKTVEFEIPTFVHITAILFDNNIEVELMNERTILDKFQSICQINQLDPEKVFKLLDNYELEDFDFEYVFNLTDYVFDLALKSESKTADTILSVFKQHFNNLNRDSWIEIFNNLDCRELQLLELVGYTSWNGFATEVFETKLIEIIRAGNIQRPEVVEFILKSFETSGKDLKNTFKNMRDELIQLRNINTELFNFFIKRLFDSGDLQEKSNDVLRTIFVANLLDDENCLDKMIENVSIINQLKENADKSSFAHFKEGIIARKDHQKVKQLGTLLSIKFPKVSKPKDE